MQGGVLDPVGDPSPSLFGNLELHRAQGRLVKDDRASRDVVVVHSKLDHIAGSELAVDG